MSCTGAPAVLPEGGRAEAQSARVEMRQVVWPGPPQPHRAAAQGDPRSGESAAVDMVQVGAHRSAATTLSTAFQPHLGQHLTLSAWRAT